MKIIILLTTTLALPLAITSWFKPKVAVIPKDSLDNLLTEGLKQAKEVKNPQMLIYSKQDAAGNLVHGVHVRAANLGKSEGFKEGTIQIINDKGKSHLLPVERVEKDLSGINRIQRQFGLAPQKMSVGEAAAIGTVATAGLGLTGWGIDASIKHKNKKAFEEDQAFRAAHGGTVENGSLVA